MAEKLNEFANKFGKSGGPKGLGTGIKLLAVAAAGAYGLKEAMFTGTHKHVLTLYANNKLLVLLNYICGPYSVPWGCVEGGCGSRYPL